jgi:hypothetical protein
LIEARFAEFNPINDVRVTDHLAHGERQVGRVQRIEFDIPLEIELFVLRIDAELVLAFSVLRTESLEKIEAPEPPTNLPAFSTTPVHSAGSSAAS